MIITFGAFAADMTSEEITTPGLFSFFPSPNPEIIETPFQIIVRDPATNATLRIDGNFTAGLASTVSGARVTTGAGELVIDFRGFSVTLQEFLDDPLGVLTALSAANHIINGSSLGDHLVGDIGNDQIHGNDGADILEGEAGNDQLFGGAGADQLKGGPGNDSYLDVGVGDTVVEMPGQGIDTVTALISFPLPPGVENLILAAGTGAIDGTGNELDNVLQGDLNHDANVLTGGKGNDTYRLEANDTIVELPGEGTDTMVTNADRPLPENVENVVLVGAATSATGNNSPNSLTGTGGANDLDGGRGPDAMTGLNGNDIYHVDCALDLVTEALSGGLDEVVTLVRLVLPANVENALAAAGVSLTDLVGNVLNNILTGNDSGNLLDGSAGNDTLNGGDGDDTLVGGDGNDLLAGGDGSDVLLGGAGADRFRFDAAPDGGNVDRVMDFVAGIDDLEFAGGVFTALTGNFAEEFVKGPGVQALEADDHLLYDTTTGRLYYDDDGSGANAPELVANFQGAPNINAADLHVV